MKRFHMLIGLLLIGFSVVLGLVFFLRAEPPEKYVRFKCETNFHNLPTAGALSESVAIARSNLLGSGRFEDLLTCAVKGHVPPNVILSAFASAQVRDPRLDHLRLIIVPSPTVNRPSEYLAITSSSNSLTDEVLDTFLAGLAAQLEMEMNRTYLLFVSALDLPIKKSTEKTVQVKVDIHTDES